MMFGTIWGFLVKLVGFIFPVFAKAKDFARWGSGMRWTLHVLAILGIVAGLIFVNIFFKLNLLLPGSGVLKYLSYVWPAAIFLLIYALAWLGWLLWKLLAAEEESSEFPDIDAAWDEG